MFSTHWEKSQLFLTFLLFREIGTSDQGKMTKQWALKGICKVGDLFEGDTLMPFKDLNEKFGIPMKHFFKYLQIRSYNQCQAKSFTI